MTLTRAMRQITDRLYFDPISILSGGDTTLSGLDLGNHTLDGVLVPTGMTGTALAVLGSVDGNNFYPLRTVDNNPVQIVLDGTAAMYVLSPLDTSCLKYIKFKSNATEGADRVLTAIGIRISEEGRA